MGGRTASVKISSESGGGPVGREGGGGVAGPDPPAGLWGGAKGPPPPAPGGAGGGPPFVELAVGRARQSGPVLAVVERGAPEAEGRPGGQSAQERILDDPGGGSQFRVGQPAENLATAVPEDRVVGAEPA